MFGLTLRDEFLRQQTPSTAIRLTDSDSGGAAQQSSEQIPKVTYPTADVQNALHALSHTRQGRPILTMGERGRGKSHIMAVMHHALKSPETVEQWASDWGQRGRNRGRVTYWGAGCNEEEETVCRGKSQISSSNPQIIRRKSEQSRNNRSEIGEE